MNNDQKVQNYVVYVCTETIMWSSRNTFQSSNSLTMSARSSERMLSFKVNLFLIASVYTFLLFSTPGKCDEEEDALLKSLNNYRQLQALPLLNKNERAACLADGMADAIKDQTCEHVHDYLPVPGSQPNFPNYDEQVKKCDIKMSTTLDAAILPVCVPKLSPSIVFDDYIRSPQYAKYISDSQYTQAGIGSKKNWMVVILSSDTTTASVSAASNFASKVQLRYCWVALLFRAFFLN